MAIFSTRPSYSWSPSRRKYVRACGFETTAIIPFGARTTPSSRNVLTCRPALPWGSGSFGPPPRVPPISDSKGSRRAILGSFSGAGFVLAEAVGFGAFFGAAFFAVRFAAGAGFAAWGPGFAATAGGFAAGLVAAGAAGLACVVAAGAPAFAAFCAAGFACGCGAGLVAVVAGFACACKPGPVTPSKSPIARVFTQRIIRSFRSGFLGWRRRARRSHARVCQLGKERCCRKHAGHRGAWPNRVFSGLGSRWVGKRQVADVDDARQPAQPSEKV